MSSKMPKLPMLNHAAGIYADMSVDGPAIGTLVCIIDRAKNLPNRKTLGKQNPYCAARLGKEAKKTDTDLRGGQTPKWDQELRYTVHESPDYFKLKVSVFNDDKKTDLIGETWIDLTDIIIPGGSQNDSWHPLQCRGKYAGEVRIEMTYYDSRPEDEKVIVKRKGVAAEKAQQARPSSSSAATGTGTVSSTLSGPREFKRRPLPTDPTGATPARPPAPEKSQSSPAPAPAQPAPARPVRYEHTHSAPPPTAADDYPRHAPRHSGAAEASRGSTSPALRPVRGYDTPDDFQREWEPVPPPHPQSGSVKRYPQEQQYSYREPSVETYDARSHHARSQSEYESHSPVEYRSMRQEPLPSRADNPPEDKYGRKPYETPPRQNSYPFAAAEQSHYSGDPASHGQVSKYSPRAANAYEQSPSEFTHSPPAPVVPEPGSHYRQHSNSVISVNSPLRNTISRDDFHAEYASMQPSVEDEEEEGHPPPPPIHRSFGHRSPRLAPAPAPAPPYQAYSPEYAASARTSTDVNIPLSGMSLSSQGSNFPSERHRLQDLPPHTNAPAMPPSLVAGYDPSIADAESDRAVHETQARRRSGLYEELATVTQPPEPLPYEAPVYPLRTSPRPVSRGDSVSPDTRMVPRRKSVSPQPPQLADRGMSSIPFSPDSYNVINPNASKSAVIRDPAKPYETPAQAMDAAIRSESGQARDLERIIGDDGREIDPSDHLPTDTWAPEPERRTKKPEVIIRFRNAPRTSAQTSPRDSAPRVSFQTPPTDGGSYSVERTGKRRPQSYMYSSPDPADRTPPRGREGHGSYAHNRNYSTPSATESPRSSFRKSISPSPRSRSPGDIYDTGTSGPPIPAKVPIAQPMNQSYPVMAGNQSMDALSRELKSIDIGSVGCSPSRAVRKYVTRASASTGYAV